jgi:hypothetical protein
MILTATMTAKSSSISRLLRTSSDGRSVEIAGNTIFRTSEKREVGGSTPPLTTRSALC